MNPTHIKYGYLSKTIKNLINKTVFTSIIYTIYYIRKLITIYYIKKLSSGSPRMWHVSHPRLWNMSPLQLFFRKRYVLYKEQVHRLVKNKKCKECDMGHCMENDTCYGLIHHDLIFLYSKVIYFSYGSYNFSWLPQFSRNVLIAYFLYFKEKKKEKKKNYLPFPLPFFHK